MFPSFQGATAGPPRVRMKLNHPLGCFLEGRLVPGRWMAVFLGFLPVLLCPPSGLVQGDLRIGSQPQGDGFPIDLKVLDPPLGKTPDLGLAAPPKPAHVGCGRSRFPETARSSRTWQIVFLTEPLLSCSFLISSGFPRLVTLPLLWRGVIGVWPGVGRGRLWPLPTGKRGRSESGGVRWLWPVDPTESTAIPLAGPAS